MSYRERGFTLIEVMVALAVVAVALPALLFILVQQVDGTAYLRDKTLASWVASNKFNEFELIVMQSGEVPKGEQRGKAELLGRDWFWRIEREDTALEGFYRVTIDVAVDESMEPTLYSLSGFFVPPVPDNG